MPKKTKPVVRLRPSAGSGLRSPLALSEVEGPEFVRFNTIKDYLKEKEKMRSAVDAVDSLTERFNSLIETVITRAVSLAKVRKRTTILAEDMKEALEKTVGKKHLAWEELLQEILLQTPIDLGNLSKGITKYIEDHQK